MKRLFFLLLLWFSLTAGSTARAAASTSAAVPDSNARLSIADATIVEGNSRFRELLFAVTLSKAQTYDVSASFKTKAVTAAANTDYTPQLAGQIVIKAGQTGASIPIRVTGDTIEERDESFLVQLSAPQRALIADSDGVGTIKDDDYAGRISIGDTTFTELNSGQKNAKLAVSLSQAPLHDISVSYETKDDSAKASQRDYIPTKGTLLFKRGQLSSSIAVPIVGDTDVEANERCFVKISASGYAITKSSGIISVLDDDYAGRISIGDTTFTELNSGQKVARLAVTFSPAPLHPIEVRYQTKDGSAKASQGDYITTKGAQIVKAGQLGFNINVPILGDVTPEKDEQCFVQLSASGYAIAKSLGTIAILNDDPIPAPILSISDISFVEGNVRANSTRARFYIQLAQPAPHDIEVSYATVDGSATAGEDYQAKSGTFVLSKGNQTAFIDVEVSPDLQEERDETFFLDLAIPADVTGDHKAQATIQDDDYAGQISISDATVGEGNTGHKDVLLQVSLSQPALHPIKVVYQTGSGSAQSPDDYLPLSGSLSFEPGQLVLTIAVPIVGDVTIEPDETLFVSLYAPSYTFARNNGLINIINDDGTVPPPVGLSGKIAFVSFRSSAGAISSDIYVMNADGSNPTRLTTTGNNFLPSFSRDGSKIVFSSSQNGSWGGTEIYVMNSDGTGQTRLTWNANRYLNHYSPSFSPDGQKIVFYSRSSDSNDNSTSSLYLMNVDGTGVNRLDITGVGSEAPQFSQVSAPAFSPDGQKIAFTTYLGNVQSIYVMNADGTDPVLLTNQGKGAYSNYFSPDSQKIAFTSERSQSEQIYSMNADGSEQIALTSAANGRNAFGSCFSPDGRKIAYTSVLNSNLTQIFVMNADGSGQTAITHGASTDQDQQPSWAPGSVPASPGASQSSASMPAPSAGAS